MPEENKRIIAAGEGLIFFYKFTDDLSISIIDAFANLKQQNNLKFEQIKKNHSSILAMIEIDFLAKDVKLLHVKQKIEPDDLRTVATGLEIIKNKKWNDYNNDYFITEEI